MTRRILVLRLLLLWGIVMPYSFLLLYEILIIINAYPDGVARWVILFLSLVILGSLATAIAISVRWVRTYRRRDVHP